MRSLLPINQSYSGSSSSSSQPSWSPFLLSGYLSPPAISSPRRSQKHIFFNFHCSLIPEATRSITIMFFINLTLQAIHESLHSTPPLALTNLKLQACRSSQPNTDLLNVIDANQLSTVTQPSGTQENGLQTRGSSSFSAGLRTRLKYRSPAKIQSEFVTCPVGCQSTPPVQL